jgi:hypothetical protein
LDLVAPAFLPVLACTGRNAGATKTDSFTRVVYEGAVEHRDRPRGVPGLARGHVLASEWRVPGRSPPNTRSKDGV